MVILFFVLFPSLKGNSCYLNSAVQCLAHTPILRLYLISGKYKRDIRLDNPLGTKGKLITAFAGMIESLLGTHFEQGDTKQHFIPIFNASSAVVSLFHPAEVSDKDADSNISSGMRNSAIGIVQNAIGSLSGWKGTESLILIIIIIIIF